MHLMWCGSKARTLTIKQKIKDIFFDKLTLMWKKSPNIKERKLPLRKPAGAAAF